MHLADLEAHAPDPELHSVVQAGQEEEASQEEGAAGEQLRQKSTMRGMAT